MKRFLTLVVALAAALGVGAQTKNNEVLDNSKLNARPVLTGYSLTWDRFNQVSPDLSCIGRIKTLPTDQLKSDNWSIGCECLDRNYANFDKYREYLRPLGITSARIQSGWARTEQKKGHYDFAWLDHIVDGLIAEGVKPWMCLCYGNPIYGGAEMNLGAKLFSDEKTMQGWLKYVEATVKHFEGRVDEFEIWNEANMGPNKYCWPQYAELLLRTSEVIRRVRPDAEIIGMCLSRNPIDFTQKVLDIVKERGRIDDVMDWVSFHPYKNNPDVTNADIDDFVKVVRSYNPKWKFFDGECGCPSRLEWTHAMRHHEWTEYSQAKWHLRRMAGDWVRNVRYSLFTFVDLIYPNMQQSFGLLCTSLEHDVVYKRPSYHAVRNMVNLLDNSKKPGGSLNFKAHTARELTVESVCDSEGKPVGAMLWFSDSTPSNDLCWENLTVVIDGLQVKDPVYIEPITGRVFDIPDIKDMNFGGRLKLPSLPLWDSPIFVMPRDMVNFEPIVSAPDNGTPTGERY